jgi:hypothetical protein
VDEMGGTCSTHGEVRNAYAVPENVKGIDHLGDVVVDAKIILKWILEK